MKSTPIAKLRPLINIRLAAAAATVLAMAGSAQASLLVYEGFDYTAGSNLNTLAGGTGFDSAWVTNTTNGGFVQIQPSGTVSGVILNDGATPNPFTATYAYLPSTGGYAGMNDGGTGQTSLLAGRADHMHMWRHLDSSVTSTFVNGTSTYFSFVSARGYNANARAPSFALGEGTLNSNRGDTIIAGTGNTSLEAIAVGGRTTGTTTGSIDGGAPVAIGNVSLHVAQYYNTTGVRSASGALGGAALSSVAGSGPQPGDHGYWMQGGGGATSLLWDYSSLNTPVSGLGDNESHVNITVGRIAWGAGGGGEDVVSFYTFHDKDALDESVFNAGALSYLTPSGSDQTQFDYISIGGGRFFVDEVRMATTFDEAVGVVPEPASLSLVAFGVCGLAGLRRRRA